MYIENKNASGQAGDGCEATSGTKKPILNQDTDINLEHACVPNNITPSHLLIPKEYAERGWVPLPVHSPDSTLRTDGKIKNSTGKEVIGAWKNIKTPEEGLAMFPNKPCNIGVKLGSVSGGLVDIDLDCEEANILAHSFLPQTELIFGRQSTPSSHWLYTSEGAKNIRFTDPLADSSSAMLLELRGDGLQTVFPPSKHHTGEHINWYSEGDAYVIQSTLLQQAVRRLAAATLLMRHWKKGTFHNGALALAGGLLRAGFSVAESKHFIGEVARALGQDDVEDRLQCVEDTAQRMKAGQSVTGWKTLAKDYVPAPVVERIMNFLGVGNAHNDDQSVLGRAYRREADVWQEPLPITQSIEPLPYPKDALPPLISDAVEEVGNFTKAPISLVANSALAAVSIATQGHVDIQRAEKLSGPCSLYLYTVAESGERKTTVDNLFMQSIRDYELAAAEEAKPVLRKYKAELEGWEARHNGLKDKIRQLAKSGKRSNSEEQELIDLEHQKPTPPRTPRFIYADTTPEALKHALAKTYPSAGICSSEGGVVLGGHAMGNDSQIRNLSTLNQLWDGVPIATERRTSESFTVRDVRLTIALQIQKPTLESFFDKTGGLARGTGFMARFLVAWPQSTQGNRPFCEAPLEWHALDQFNQRIASTLSQELCIDEDGALQTKVVRLSKQAKAAWIKFHDTVESDLRADGDLFTIRDVASKAADNAARLACLFQMFERNDSSEVEFDAFERASRIIAWHLHEAKRFYGELALPPDQCNAKHLDAWLIDHCRRENVQSVTRRDVQRLVTPHVLRKGGTLSPALKELVELDRIHVVKEGKKTVIYINPSLLSEES